jgi:hypothetical protein
MQTAIERIGKNKYNNIHTWLRYHYGKATKCSNTDCQSGGQRRYQWALKTGEEYAKDITKYIPLCPSCHRKYDMTDELKKKLAENNSNHLKTHCKRGHKFEKSNILMVKDKRNGKMYRSCKTCTSERQNTLAYKLSRPTVYSTLAEQYKNNKICQNK